MQPHPVLHLRRQVLRRPGQQEARWSVQYAHRRKENHRTWNYLSNQFLRYILTLNIEIYTSFTLFDYAVFKVTFTIQSIQQPLLLKVIVMLSSEQSSTVTGLHVQAQVLDCLAKHDVRNDTNNFHACSDCYVNPLLVTSRMARIRCYMMRSAILNGWDILDIGWEIVPPSTAGQFQGNIVLLLTIDCHFLFSR